MRHATVVDEKSPRFRQEGNVEDVDSNERGTAIYLSFPDGKEEAFEPHQVEDSRLLCICGSLQFGRALYDARGIYVSGVCDACEELTRARYRPEIFRNSAYEADEPIEEDY